MGRHASFLKKLRKGVKPRRVHVAAMVCRSCGYQSRVAAHIARLGAVICRCGVSMCVAEVVEPPADGTPMPTLDPRTKEGYYAYLRSPWWQSRRRGRVNRAKGRCEKCGDNNLQLHVHHLTYERIGRELDADLEVLCEACHHKEHPGWT